MPTRAGTAWRTQLSDPDAREAVAAAASEFMRSACIGDHRNNAGNITTDPAYCDCPANLVTPREFFDWIEREIHLRAERPARIEPAGRPNRLRSDPRLSLALTG